MTLLRSRAPLLAAFAAAAVLAGVLRHTARSWAPPAVDLQLDVPAIPGEVARPLAFGFRSLLADFTFIEAIQVLAQRRGDATYAESVPFDRRLQRLLEYSIEVDPAFGGAYRLAGYALPHETPDGKAAGVLGAVQILERGERERPQDWQISLCLGFLRSYYLRDFTGAANALAAAAKQPGAPRYVGLLATRLAAQGGELQMATMLAEANLAQANEEDTRKEWEKRVADLHTERDLRALEAAVERYRAGHAGAPPRSLAALAQAGLISRVPQEPHGGRYLIDAEGAVRSTAADRLRIHGGTTNLEVH